GGAIRMMYVTSSLTLSSQVTFPTETATSMSVTVDNTTNSPIIYASYYDSGTLIGKTLAVSAALAQILAPTTIVTAEAVTNITSVAQNSVNTVFYEVTNAYSYDSGIPTNYIKSRTITQAGVLGTAAVVVRSVGLASKAFILDNNEYFLTSYFSLYQPSYFLVDSSGKVVAKLAYSNGGGYLVQGLPNITMNGSIVSVCYLLKDLIAAVNKTQGSSIAGVYSQTGVNLVTFDLSTMSSLSTSEIAGGLNISGGFVWHYDGVKPVENNFFVWPDNVETTIQTAAGSMTAQQYFYIALYQSRFQHY
ncbi:MAG: hypothetical protein V4440_12995, partial [Pseudomonadota bacterium]